MSKRSAFSPADILLPAEESSLTHWAVVACDQYTSQPEYWDRVDAFVGETPSALRLILPESKLESEHVQEEIQAIQKNMADYLEDKRFRLVENTYIYVERQLQNGRLRKGLLGQLDLEQYSFEPGAETLVRATEGTVLERIPPRMEVRRDAPIELPHILVLIDDPEKTVIEALGKQKKQMNSAYAFQLMEESGRISGWILNEEQKERVKRKLERLSQTERFEGNYNAHGMAPLIYAVGDGNHSLATAKACWEEIKQTLPEEKWERHPARYALVELTNLHDPSLEFEAIHRIVLDVEPEALLQGLLRAYPGSFLGEGYGHRIRYVYGETEAVLTIPNPKAQLEVGSLQRFLDRYLKENGGRIDYIHGEDVVRQLAEQPRSIGFLLPPMEKNQLFPTVIFDGVLPRKTFSMGEASDKRFYLEARQIQ